MNISATELPNFIRKCYLLLKLFQILTTKYFSFHTASHTAVRHSGVQSTEHVRHYQMVPNESSDLTGSYLLSYRH